MCQNALPSHIVDARLTFPMKNAMPARDHLMKFDITSFQAVAANLAVEGEVCDLAHAKRSTPTETDPEIAPLIEKVGATSIAEIDRLIAELQDARNYLISEGERIERETVRYANLTLMLPPRPRSSLTPSPNGILRATNKTLPKSRRLRSRTTSERSGKVITTVSRTPPNSVKRLMSLRGRQRTPSYNNNAGALAIFWKSGGPTFSENHG